MSTPLDWARAGERIHAYHDDTYGWCVRVDMPRDPWSKSRANRNLRAALVELAGWSQVGLRIRTSMLSQSLTHVTYRLDRAWYVTT